MSNNNFSGQVNQTLDLSEIFQSLAQSRQQGTLTIRDRYRTKAIYFEEGQVTLISEPRRIRLGSLLVSTGKLNEDDLDLAIKLQKRSNKRLGEILVEEAFCTDVDIQRCVRYQVECELYDVFLWKDISYAFQAGPMQADEVSGQVTQVRLDSESLLTEANHRLQEWRDSINPLVPSLREIYVTTDRTAEGLGLPDKFMAVVPLIDGKHNVEDLAQAAQLSDFEVCKHLAKMAKIGAVAALGVVELTSRARESFALQDFATAAKLFARLEELYPEDLQYQLPLADSLRQAQKKQEALEVYGQIALQLETKQIEFDTLKSVYQYIYQIDANRADVLQKLKDLEEARRQRQAARRRWVPYVILLIGAIAVAALWVWIFVKYKRQRNDERLREKEVTKLLGEYESARKAKKWQDFYEVGETLIQKYGDVEGVEKVVLPIQIRTRPPGFSIFVNGKEIGKTSYETPKITGTYDPRAGSVLIEVASDSNRTQVWNTTKRRAFQYLDLYEEVKGKTSFLFNGEAEFQSRAGWAPKLNSFVASSRDGNVYVIDLKSADSFGQLNSRTIQIGQYGDILSSVAVDGATAFVGTVSDGVCSIDLDAAQIKKKYPAKAPVVASPLVNGERVVVADSSGEIVVYSRVAAAPQKSFRRPAQFSHDGVWDNKHEHAFFAGSDGHLVKIEAKTGNLAQELDLRSKPASRLIASSKRLAVLNDSGIALVTSSFDLKLGFKEFKSQGKGPFDLAMTDSMVFISSRDNLVAYDVHSGAVRWRWRDETASEGRSQIDIVQNRLVFSQGNKWLRAFSLDQGQLLWHGGLASGRIAGPLAVGDEFVFAGLDGISLVGFSPFYHRPSEKKQDEKQELETPKKSSDDGTEK